MNLNYELRRSARQTLALEVTRQGRVIVRAPLEIPQAKIDAFLLEKNDWINKHIKKFKARPPVPQATAEQAAELIQKARAYIPSRVEYFSKIMGVSPQSVKITSAQKRFGSCSGSNSLCFAWRLMLYPPQAIDYVIVHELAHIYHHNHSKAFYDCVKKYMPDYKQRAALLK